MKSRVSSFLSGVLMAACMFAFLTSPGGVSVFAVDTTATSNGSSTPASSGMRTVEAGIGVASILGGTALVPLYIGLGVSGAFANLPLLGAYMVFGGFVGGAIALVGLGGFMIWDAAFNHGKHFKGFIKKLGF